MPQLHILSPLSGQVWPLERIRDPVFAQKMVGDGLSVDPTDSMLLAGCDGDVVSLHAAGHALTLRTAESLDVLMHVGIDTVMLKGQGFRARVKAGDRVRTGTPLTSSLSSWFALLADGRTLSVSMRVSHAFVSSSRTSRRPTATDSTHSALPESSSLETACKRSSARGATI